MNPVAVLQAAVSLAIFPGVAFTGTVALAVAVAGRLPPGLHPPPLDELAAAGGIAAACGLLALAGSPLFGLPAGISLVALLIAIAGGTAWGTAERWPWHRVVAGLACAAPLLGLASMAMTLDLRTLTATGGPAGTVRDWAVTAILVAAPAVVRPFDRQSARASRAALMAAVGLTCASLAASAPLAGLPAWWAAATCAISAVAYAGLIGAARRILAVAAPILGVAAIVPAVVALAVALA